MRNPRLSSSLRWASIVIPPPYGLARREIKLTKKAVACRAGIEDHRGGLHEIGNAFAGQLTCVRSFGSTLTTSIPSVERLPPDCRARLHITPVGPRLARRPQIDS